MINNVVVLDTSVILHDSGCLSGFVGCDIVIPLIVLDEIDKFRPVDNEVGRSARSAIRTLNDLREQGGDFVSGIQRLETGEKIYIRALQDTGLSRFKTTLNIDKNDDVILAICSEVKDEFAGRKVTLKTKDISLSVKANVLQLDCSDYTDETIVKDTSKLYTGVNSIDVRADAIEDLYRSEELVLDTVVDVNNLDFNIYENMGLILRNVANSSHTAVAVYKDGFIKKLNYKGKPICNIKPKNIEQTLAFEYLLDDSIDLVTFTGKAGVGKTLISLAAAINMVMDKSQYDRLVVSRPIQPLGKDMGYLPGDALEKIAPWMGPVKDAVEFIFGGKRSQMEDMIQYGVIEIEPLTYIRGRSLPRTLFILDEAQNTSHHEMKTVITRMGEGSKLVLCGDVHQIDNHYLDIYSNGLTRVVEKFKESGLSAHVTFTRGQRSRLASLAADVL